jgi:SecD/SecF fusion protein
MSRRTIIKIVIAIGVALFGAFGGWELYSKLTRPSMERHGGTILIYQVDEKEASYTPEEMAATIQRRLDPRERLGIAVLPGDSDRMEIRIPRGLDHAALVDRSKELILQAGRLEFRIAANSEDDAVGIEAAKQAILRAQDHQDVRAQLEACALKGQPPPAPRTDQGGAFPNGHNYSWFEVGRTERVALRLAQEPGPYRDDELWDQLAEARKSGRTHLSERFGLFYSRDCRGADPGKKVEVFLLCRDPERDATSGRSLGVSGADFQRVYPTEFLDHPCVSFSFSPDGGERFYRLTSQNVPTGEGDEKRYRFLAIILDGQILSMPRLNAAIRREGVIQGEFTQEEVNNLCQILVAGALPATLRPMPISETAVGPTDK